MTSRDALDAYSEALAAGARFLMLHDKTRERPEEGCDPVAELDRLAPVYTELRHLHVAAMKYAEAVSPEAWRGINTLECVRETEESVYAFATKVIEPLAAAGALTAFNGLLRTRQATSR
ncbi:hypothetical protein [Kitasatospora sp. NPDC058190]|uniref:hypothetical protein n=1 Tax=Kitasatospora sp. NPDC058190 TaxID=3346371 RepID=UPI0036DD34C3